MAILVALGVGILTVLQGGMNKSISGQYGIAGATVLNSLLVLVFAVGIYFVVNHPKSPFPPYMKLPEGWTGVFRWWYVLPGLCGCLVVLGIPLGIIHIGAMQTMVFMICAQVVASMAWDLWVENIALSELRVLGGALVMGGAVLVCLGGVAGAKG